MIKPVTVGELLHPETIDQDPLGLFLARSNFHNPVCSICGGDKAWLADSVDGVLYPTCIPCVWTRTENNHNQLK